MRGLQRFVIPPHQGWPEIKILRPTPYQDDPWGSLAPLQGTPWGDLLTIVSGVVMSNALHGYAMPLIKELGVLPSMRLRRLQNQFCAQRNTCALMSELCHPNIKVPDCYSPPAPPLEPEAVLPARTVTLAWKENRYVILVEGEEFSIG